MYQTSRNEKHARFYSSLYLKQVFSFKNKKALFIICFFTNQKYFLQQRIQVTIFWTLLRNFKEEKEH